MQMFSQTRLFLVFFLIFFLTKFYSISAKSSEIDISTIYQNIRCLVCQGQSIDESNSDFAQNLKTLIQKKVDNGLSEEEIYYFLKHKYGEWILLKPTFNYKTFFLWIFPYLIFTVGGIFVFLLVKKSRT